MKKRGKQTPYLVSQSVLYVRARPCKKKHTIYLVSKNRSDNFNLINVCVYFFSCQTACLPKMSTHINKPD